jgi:hypothetical protein
MVRPRLTRSRPRLTSVSAPRTRGTLTNVALRTKVIVLIRSQMRKPHHTQHACKRWANTHLLVWWRTAMPVLPPRTPGLRESQFNYTAFFLTNCNRHATLLSGPANDKTISSPTHLQMPLPGIIQPVLCKAIDNCSEFDQETLSNARAKFQSTWPKCFRVEDLWLHAHRSARPVEKSLTTPHAQE